MSSVRQLQAKHIDMVVALAAVHRRLVWLATVWLQNHKFFISCIKFLVHFPNNIFITHNLQTVKCWFVYWTIWWMLLPSPVNGGGCRWAVLVAELLVAYSFLYSYLYIERDDDWLLDKCCKILWAAFLLCVGIWIDWTKMHSLRPTGGNKVTQKIEVLDCI
jgi:hypothetical protein